MSSLDGEQSFVQSLPANKNTTTRTSISEDDLYTFDEESLEEFRKNAPWNDDPKWFNNVAISPTAIMKMMTHTHSGVEKGLKKGGNPIEVMGLLLGRPDPKLTHTLIVTDVFPLPIEGFETSVVADDIDVSNHMIALGEVLENTRKEKFMGWYHSHPFEVGPHSHCFLSQTDLSTQLLWQRQEDPHGNPYLAIVVDPQRSLAKNAPEIKAFRAYPPQYTNPISNSCPNGDVIPEERLRLEKWGSCWASYYELHVDYFMSKMSRTIMDGLTRNFLWIRTLGTTPSLDVESRCEFPRIITDVAEQLNKLDVASIIAGDGGGGSGGGSRGSVVPRRGKARGGNVEPSPTASNVENENDSEVTKACQSVVNIATERICTNIVQVTKKELFS